jgi:hypothetical protein
MFNAHQELRGGSQHGMREEGFWAYTSACANATPKLASQPSHHSSTCSSALLSYSSDVPDSLAADPSPVVMVNVVHGWVSELRTVTLCHQPWQAAPITPYAAGFAVSLLLHTVTTASCLLLLL